jgi:hypothetical protein
VNVFDDVTQEKVRFLLLFDCQLSPVEHLQNGTHYELGLAIVGKKIVLLLWCLERVSTSGLYSNS